MSKKNRYWDYEKEKAYQKKMVNKGIITWREYDENMRYYLTKKNL